MLGIEQKCTRLICDFGKCFTMWANKNKWTLLFLLSEKLLDTVHSVSCPKYTNTLCGGTVQSSMYGKELNSLRARVSHITRTFTEIVNAANP